jgi:hypothetical protein
MAMSNHPDPICGRMLRGRLDEEVRRSVITEATSLASLPGDMSSAFFDAFKKAGGETVDGQHPKVDPWGGSQTTIRDAFDRRLETHVTLNTMGKKPSFFVKVFEGFNRAGSNGYIQDALKKFVPALGRFGKAEVHDLQNNFTVSVKLEYLEGEPQAMEKLVKLAARMGTAVAKASQKE